MGATFSISNKGILSFMGGLCQPVTQTAML